jgi:hypothetical protein
LQEYIYSSKDGNTWDCAALNNLKIVLDPTSSIAAVLSLDNIISIYYQGRCFFPFINDLSHNYLRVDPDSDFIRILWRHVLKNDWQQGPTITKALKGTKIAIVQSPDSLYHRLYYQGPLLHLSEYYFDPSKMNWVFGKQVLGLFLSTKEHSSYSR